MAPRAIVLFSRSLRTVDNTALASAQAEGYEVVPVFVFTPEQIDPKKNRYFSRNAVQFMVESLVDLADHAPMVFLYDTTTNALARVCAAVAGIVAVIDTVDYTPYARDRSAAVQAWCQGRGLRYMGVEDLDLFPIGDVLRAPGEPYKVFTPYYQKALEALRGSDLAKGDYRAMPFGGKYAAAARVPGALHAGELARFYGGAAQKNNQLEQRGGRTEGLKRLRMIRGIVENYAHDREIFAMQEGTTRMSAHIKFGTVSVREVAAESIRWGGIGNGILRQLVFRSFYYKNMWFRPDQLRKGVPFKNGVVQPARALAGTPSWEQFVRGETGIDILDAAVRCIEATGYMHNRLRLLVASYVTKDMAVDWHVLERWFAQRLVDYDPISNNAGVQTGASLGPSAGPMFRRMSPMVQARKYDPDGAFVRRWLPERSGTDGGQLGR